MKTIEEAGVVLSASDVSEILTFLRGQHGAKLLALFKSYADSARDRSDKPVGSAKDYHLAVAAKIENSAMVTAFTRCARSNELFESLKKSIDANHVTT